MNDCRRRRLLTFTAACAACASVLQYPLTASASDPKGSSNSNSSSSSSSSSSSTNNKTAAQALFEQGRDLVLSKNYADGCPKLAQSLELDRGIGTMLWLADCYEKSGQASNAWMQFKAAAALANERHDERAGVALRRAAILEAQLTRIVIVVPREQIVEGLVIQRDGVVVTTAEFGGPLPVQPGTHRITVSAPNREPWSANVFVPSTPTAVAVNVPVLEVTHPKDKIAAVAAATAPTAEVESVQSAHTPTFSGMRVAGVSVAAIGLVSIGAGTFFGFHAKSIYASSNQDGHCTDNHCDSDGKNLRSDAMTAATESTAAFSIGAGLVVLGAGLYLLAPREKTGVAVLPSISAHHASMSLSKRW